MKKFFEAVLAAIAIFLFLPGMTAQAADDGRIAEGVYIGRFDVSGLSVSEATALVENGLSQDADEGLTLSAGEGRELEIKGSDIGIYWANKDVVKEAYALGRSGNIVQRYKALKDLEESNQVFTIELGFDDEALSAIVQQCKSSFDQETVNYKLVKSSDGFSVTEGQTGYLIDEDESIAVIKHFIQEYWGPGSATIQLSVKEDAPKGSAEELAKVRDVLGTYTTSYSTSGAARSANVANGCSLIDGSTIYPGEEFSVLETITPFTEANGYYPAGSYLNGLVVESIGGGICQVSTTLYNAVLLAELEVTERHNHSMIVTYVEPSADAAIAESGGKNFKFVNNTDYPIYIEGSTTSDKHITFTIYGVETRSSSRKIRYESEVLEKTPASDDQYVTDSSQALGYVGTQSAHLGYKAQLWKIVTENGTETSREVVNSSNYKMVPRIITVGTAGADETAMSQLQTAIATRDVATVKSVAGALAAARTAAGTENAEAAAQAAADAVNAAQQQLQAAEAETIAEEADTSEVVVTD